MSNHIINHLEINADNNKVQEIMNFLKGEPNEDGSVNYIDFNKIIPMPKKLMINSSTLGELGVKYIQAMQRMPNYTPKDLETIKRFESFSDVNRQQAMQLGVKYLSNIMLFGYPTWYEWANAIWGTKWNAYNQDFDEPNILWFDTAWSGVPQLIGKLSEKYPDVEFLYTYADEYFGTHTGKGSIKNGKINMTFPFDGSREAYEITFIVKPGLENSFKLTPEGYEWK